MSAWRDFLLGQALDFSSGKSVKPGGSGRYPVYGSAGVIGHSDEFLYSDAIIIGRVGAYCGAVEYCKRRFWASDNTIVARPKDSFEAEFMYYLLGSLDLRQHAGGSAQPLMTQTVIKNIRAKAPSLTTQRKIAAILSAYDDLIENNLNRIAILEETAQLIYREWFVNFRFPGHDSVRMGDSPLGAIPEGWEVAPLGDILAVLESGSRPKGGIDESDRDVPSIGAENILGLGRYDYSKEKYVRQAFFERMKRGYVRSGDVLLYKDGAHIGRKSMFRDDFPHRTCCVNEHVFILRTNDRCSQGYLYFWLDQPEMTQEIRNLNSNAAQPGINQAGVRGLPILLPPESILVSFEGFAEPMVSALFNLAKRNNVLHRTRDLLLPRLISGELNVSDLDINAGGLTA